MNSYWAQFDREEIKAMYGVDDADLDEEIDPSEYEDDDQKIAQIDPDVCPRCTRGCNYCLMVGY